MDFLNFGFLDAAASFSFIFMIRVMLSLSFNFPQKNDLFLTVLLIHALKLYFHNNIKSALMLLRQIINPSSILV